MTRRVIKELIHIPVYLLVFFLPLLFLPFSVEGYEFPKLYALIGLTLLGIIAWLVDAIFYERAFTFKRTPLDIAVGVLVAGVLVSALFSQDWISSLFGFYGRFSGSVAELIAWVLLYLTVTNTFTYREAKQLLDILLASAFVLALWFHASFWGFFASLLGTSFFGNMLFLKATLSSIVTTPESLSPQALAVFLSLALVFLLVRWAMLTRSSRLLAGWYTVVFFALLSSLVVINFFPAWIILLVSLAPFFAWTLRARLLQGSELNRLALTILTALASLFFLVFSPSLSGLVSVFSPDLAARLTVPQELTLLTQSASWRVSGNTISSFPYTLVGVGPANFFVAYTRFRPLNFNQSPDWWRRFDIGSSHYATILATTGLVGAVSFVLFAAFVAYLFTKLSKGALPVKREGTMYFFIFLSLLVSFLVYYQNITLALVFWLLLGILATLLSRVFPGEEYRYDFGVTPEANLFLTAVFFALFFVMGLLGYGVVRFYLADIAYAKSFTIPDPAKRLSSLNQAVALNPLFIQYRASLGQESLAQAREQVQRAGATGPSDITPIALLVSQAFSQAQNITALAPHTVASWEASASIYRNILAFINDQPSRAQLIQSATQALERAQELEPTNPAFPVQLAQLFIANDGDLKKAREALQNAKALKADYGDIPLAEAMLLEKQKKLTDAIALLESTARRGDLSSVQLEQALFQLGRIAYNTGQYQKAVDALSIVVKVDPRYSDAHYALGLAYEAVKDVSQAKAEYKKVLELNPGNTEVRARLQRL